MSSFYRYEHQVTRLPYTPGHHPEERDFVVLFISVQSVVRNYWRTTPATPDGLPVTYHERLAPRPAHKRITIRRRALSFSPENAPTLPLQAVSLALSSMGVGPEPDLSSMGVGPEPDRTRILRSLCGLTGPTTTHQDFLVHVRAVEYHEYDDDDDDNNGDDDDVAGYFEGGVGFWGRAGAGAGTEAIEGLRKVRFGKGSSDSEQCVICLEEFEKGTEVTCMPCEHVFHEECIDKWLKTSQLCPLCRFSLSELNPTNEQHEH